MNRGNVLQSSPLHQMIAGGPNGWWSMMATTRPSTPPPPQQPFYGSSLQPHFFPHQYAPPLTIPSSSQAPWHNNQDIPDSLSQLLMSGLVSEDDNSALSHMQQVKKLENWEQLLLLRDHHRQQQQQNSLDVQALEESTIKQENSLNYGSAYGQGNSEFHGTKPSNWSNQMIPVSSPTSCVSSLSNNMVDFSTTTSNKADGRHPPPDRSSECNSTATGGASKKAKIKPSSNQSTTTFKVRKENLGDRITALHQLVSPFGKTDTASVLLEAIGYIRFLQSQIEALSLPYLGGGSAGNMRTHQHSVQQGERNCLFPEDPGQLVNDSCMKMKGAALDQNCHEEPMKDLKSRGLCLVPVSCTMQVGSDNGADYWAPALNGGFR